MITAVTAASGNAGGIAGAISLWTLAVALYWVPSIVALCRKGQVNLGGILVVNGFLGWTIVGWIVALAMACKSPPPPQVPPPGWQYPPPGWTPPGPRP